MITRTSMLWKSLFMMALLGSSASRVSGQEALGRVFNPIPHPEYPDLIAFERMISAEARELWFQDSETGKIFPLQEVEVGGVLSLDDLLGADEDDVRRFSGHLDWYPTEDRDRLWFTYVAGEADQGLAVYFNYLDEDGSIGLEESLTLPFSGDARTPRWSPFGDRMVFESEGRLYLVLRIERFLRSNGREAPSISALDQPTGPSLFPVWSPDGHHLAYQVQEASGTRGIEVLYLGDDRVSPQRPALVTQALSETNETRPSWSPDGRYLAYYIDQERGEDQLDIGIVEVQKDVEGRIFRGEILTGRNLRLAEDVIENNARGPSWSYYANRGRPALAILYVARDANRQNPLEIAALDAWRSNMPSASFRSTLSERARWSTVNHRDPTSVPIPSTPRLRFAFVSQVEGGEALQVRDIALDLETPQPLSGSNGAALRSLMFPGLGQIRNGDVKKGLLLSAAGVSAGLLFATSGLEARSALNSLKKTAAANEDMISTSDPHYQDWKSAKDRTRMAGLLLGAVWVYGIVDALLSGPGGDPDYFSPVQFEVQPSAMSNLVPGGPTADLKVSIPLPSSRYWE